MTPLSWPFHVDIASNANKARGNEGNFFIFVSLRVSTIMGKQFLHHSFLQRTFLLMWALAPGRPFLLFSEGEFSTSHTLRERFARHIRILASPEMAGRFVHDSGIWKAKSYIENVLKNAGLKVVSYPFTEKANVIEDVVLVVDGDTLQPGTQFLVAPWMTSMDTVISCNKCEMCPPIKKVRNTRDVRFRKDTSFIALTMDTSLNFIHSLATRAYPGIGLLIQRDTCHNIHLRIKSTLKQFTFYNVAGIYSGYKDEWVIFVAHYDHLGKLGNSFFPGASDNASGVALLLTMAEMINQWKPSSNVIFLFTAGEEMGLLGSLHLIKSNPLPPPSKTVVINLDIVGGGDNGIVVVGAYEHRKIFRKIKKWWKRNGAPFPIKKRKMAPNSDQYAFHLAGFPAVFIYTDGGASWYHNPGDKPEQLSMRAVSYLIDCLRSAFLR